MKKLLLTLSMLFIVVITCAQAYIPMPDSGAIWRVGKGDMYTCEEKQYYTSGDTIISGITYTKIAVIKNIGTPYGTLCNVRSSSNGLAGMIRNDTINKKVYIISPGQTSEQLLYNFDLNINDTFPNTLIYDSAYFQYIVFSIDTVLIGGKMRKIMLSDDTVGIGRYSLIEGIGSSQGLIDTVQFGFRFDELWCFKLDGQTIYPDSNAVCNLITGITKNQNQSDSGLLVYPNPTTEQITITQNQNLERITLYSLQGQKLQELLPDKRESTGIEIRGPKGIYLLRLQMKDRSMHSMKIFKQ